jgi:hypothetical protein
MILRNWNIVGAFVLAWYVSVAITHEWGICLIIFAWYLLVSGKTNLWPGSLMNKIFRSLESSYMIDVCAKQKVTVSGQSQYSKQVVGWTIWGRGKRFPPKCWDQVWESYSVDTWGSFFVGKVVEAWTDHSPLPNAKVKNEWSCTTLPLPHWMYLRNAYHSVMTFH